MGPVSHFTIGAFGGAAIASVVLVFRRRWALYFPPFVLACGFWAELPCLVGARGTTHWLANVFFGYAWLHPWVSGRELYAFAVVVVAANVLLFGYVAFLTGYFWTVDTVRWERSGGGRGRRRSRGGSSNGRRRKETVNHE